MEPTVHIRCSFLWKVNRTGPSTLLIEVSIEFQIFVNFIDRGQVSQRWKQRRPGCCAIFQRSSRNADSVKLKLKKTHKIFHFPSDRIESESQGRSSSELEEEIWMRTQSTKYERSGVLQ